MGKRREPQGEDVESWLEREVAGCQFHDVRHGKRFRALIGQFAERIGGSIPFACQDWVNTKAAYRFLAKRGSASRPLRLRPYWFFMTLPNSSTAARSMRPSAW